MIVLQEVGLTSYHNQFPVLICTHLHPKIQNKIKVNQDRHKIWDQKKLTSIYSLDNAKLFPKKAVKRAMKWQKKYLG